MYSPVVGWLTKMHWVVPVLLFSEDVIVYSFDIMASGSAVDVFQAKYSQTLT